jgi:hypothetical protein
MKKILSVLMMTFVLIGMSACSKDKDLTGTTWTASVTQTEEGVTFTTNFTLKFTTETEGSLTFSAMGFTETQNFTYTYDDGKGTMTNKPTEDEPDMYTINFTVEDDELTVTDDDVTIVFKKQK